MLLSRYSLGKVGIFGKFQYSTVKAREDPYKYRVTLTVVCWHQGSSPKIVKLHKRPSPSSDRGSYPWARLLWSDLRICLETFQYEAMPADLCTLVSEGVLSPLSQGVCRAVAPDAALNPPNLHMFNVTRRGRAWFPGNRCPKKLSDT